jgi:FtsZ-interacting cell division protein ZipA
MKKKILLLSIILICGALIMSACGAKKQSVQKQVSQQIQQPQIEEFIPIDEVDLSDSGLEPAQIPEINMNLEFETDSEIDAPQPDDLEVPEVNLDAPPVPPIDNISFDGSQLANQMTGQGAQAQQQKGQGSQDTSTNQASQEEVEEVETQATQQAAEEAQETAAQEAETQAAEQATEEAAEEAQEQANQEQTGTPPADYVPDAATCAQFDAAPSCSYVPAESQDLCNKCKGN